MDMRALDRLRAPHPNQADIDEHSAKLLRESWRHSKTGASVPEQPRRRRRRKSAQTPA
jgi:hypothetical protein